MFICGFDAMEPNPAITQLIQEYGLGGVIYFRRNVKDAHQLAHLSAELQEMSLHSGDNHYLSRWIKRAVWCPE